MAESTYHGYEHKDNYILDDSPMLEIIPLTSAELPSIALSQSSLNTDTLQKLAQFLETSQSDSSFPSISVIPDFVRDIANYALERKRIKFEHDEFLKKLTFLSEGLNRQFQVSYTQIMKNTEIQLAQINGNTQVQLAQISRYYDIQMKKVVEEVSIRRTEMEYYYRNLDKQLKEQAQRFDKMMKFAMIERQTAQRAIHEAEEVSRYLKTKLYKGTITNEERTHYMELLRFRLESVNSISAIIPQLASRIT